MMTRPEIQLQSVSKWYGPVIGVNDIDLEIGPGIVGLLGPNGAGKSTLMKLVTGQLKPSLGEVRVRGLSAWRRPEARRAIGYAPDVDRFHEEATCFDFVRALARLSGLSRRDANRRTEEAIAAVGMTPFRTRRLRQCSKGMRQRIKLAQAIVHDPAVLILDEPLTGVDPPGRIELQDLFRCLGERGRTLVISSHILEEVEAVTDRVVLLARGRLLAHGAVDEIREWLSDRPRTIRITGAGLRGLAAAMLRSDRVVGVSLRDDDGGLETLVAHVRQDDLFLRDLPRLVLELGTEISSVEPLDAGAAAVFDYLVYGKRHDG